MDLELAGLHTLIVDEGVAPDAPVIVALHGIGADEKDLLPIYLRWSSRAVLVFPRAPHPYPPGHAWYALERPGHPVSESFMATQEHLGSWLEALKGLPPLAGRAVYLSGFSQGAFAALAYALKNPEDVAGVMTFSGLLPRGFASDWLRPPSTVQQLPVFLSLGVRDPLFPMTWWDETVGQLRAWGLNPTAVPHPGGHEIPLFALAAADAWLEGRIPSRLAGC